MIDIFLIGGSTAVGKHFQRLILQKELKVNLINKSRKNQGFNYFDLNNPESFKSIEFKRPCLIINFGPLWLFTKFINHLDISNDFRSNMVKAILCTSSSSILSKRFSGSIFDKELVKKLKDSENIIVDFCLKHRITYQIVRPSLIYSSIYSKINDKNIRLLRNLMRIVPIILLPNNNGLRQPIHACELAKYFINLVEKIMNKNPNHHFKSIIEIGGDSYISYIDIFYKIREKVTKKDPAKYCFIVSIPDRLFYLACCPIILISPKIYFAILRISSDLAGFNKVSELLNEKSKEFPVLEN